MLTISALIWNVMAFFYKTEPGLAQFSIVPIVVILALYKVDFIS